MGIFCAINLCTPADGRYIYKPGSIISGAIRYCLDEEYEFTSISISLKGLGHLYLEDIEKKKSEEKYHTNDEIYVDLKKVIYSNEKGEAHSIGQYETRFSFQLPYNIPGSIDYKKNTDSYNVVAYVKYFIRIKFKRPMFFRLNKQYKKDIIVMSVQTPRLTTKPLVYGDKKTLLQLKSLFASNKGFVNIKAVIANSVRSPGEFVKVDYEIINNTNKAIKDIELKISEVDQYTSVQDLVIKVHTDVEGAKCLYYEGIAGGDTGKFTVEIMIPQHCASIDHCKFLSRDYSLMTLVRLPDPHLNLPLEIPFQVIETLSGSFEDNAFFSNDTLPVDDPPTYWEAMAEDTKDISENKEVENDTLESTEVEEYEKQK